MNASIADRRRKATPGSRSRSRRARTSIGIDVGDRFSEICVLDQEGHCTAPHFAQRVREQTPEHLKPVIAPLVAAIDSLTEQIRT